MKVLFDTNILLDVLLKRDPFFDASAQLLAYAEQGKIEGWLCGTTVTTIYYLLSRTLARKKAVIHLRQLLKILHISGVTRVVLEDALESGFTDYEDAVLYHSALHARAEIVLTRNQKDFSESSLPIYSPAEFLKAEDILK
nr:PIN domain protein [uncultured bacterium]